MPEPVGEPIPPLLVAGAQGSTRAPLVMAVGRVVADPVVAVGATLPAFPDVPTVGVVDGAGAVLEAEPVGAGLEVAAVVLPAALLPGEVAAAPGEVPAAPGEVVVAPLPEVAAAPVGVVADGVPAMALPVAGVLAAVVDGAPLPTVGVRAGVPVTPPTPGAVGSHGASGVARGVG